MILAVRCDQPQFRSVSFTSGFNLIVAERESDSSDKDSRNGLGKTTLLRIIDFCLGSGYSKNIGVYKESLSGWTFILDLQLRGKKYTVYRNTDNYNIVHLEGDFEDWPIQPVTDDSGLHSLKIQQWRDLLGWAMFSIDVDLSDSWKYRPSFRSLISFFIRIGRESYVEPFVHNPKQLEWDKQINNTFLLGLGWEYASRWQLLRDRENALRQFRQIASSESSILPTILGTKGELEAERIRLDEQIKIEGQRLEQFKVHEQYDEIRQRADQLTRRMHEYVNQNFHDSRTIEFYENSLKEEKVDDTLVEALYREAGVVLPDNLLKRIDEVNLFHREVTANRRRFLESEINRLKNAINDRKHQIQLDEKEKVSFLRILNTHGALEEYNVMHERYQSLIAKRNDVLNRINALRKLDQEKAAIGIEREQILLDANADKDTNLDRLQHAISIFNSVSKYLYESPGSLIVDIEKTGYKFRIDILRSTSDGIQQIGQVFTYDLTLVQLWSMQQINPGFLVHDSSIFDGVDERQVALALRFAIEMSSKSNFQYICCLNSDNIPYKDLEDINIHQYIRLTLMDGSQEGSLLGIRF